MTLTAGRVRATQPLVVRMDPRVKTPAAALDDQFTLSMRVYDAIARVHGKLTPPPQTTDEGLRPRRAIQSGVCTRPAAIAYDALQEVDVAPTRRSENDDRGPAEAGGGVL